MRSDSDFIIELAAYCPERKTTFCELINPGCPIPPEATAIHKITDEMVANAPPFKEVAEQFIEFCEGDVVLIAHNNDAFDKRFLEQEYGRAGVPLPEWAYIDTLKWARRYRPDLPRHSLQFLRQAYGIAANQAHRALDDVQVLHQIFAAMIDDLDYETVMELLAQNGKVKHMPFGKYRGMPLVELPPDYLRWLKGSGALDKPDNENLKEALQQAELV